MKIPLPLTSTPRMLFWITLPLPPLIRIASWLLPTMRLEDTVQPLPPRPMPVKFGTGVMPFAATPIRLLTIRHRSGVLTTVLCTLMP